ncbi:hypothetical protein SAMN04488498_10415 [Mesorhizobium albiziae]|uniref:Uncharacterized protein n=1 Tax=Neomesorhizobium albiziae TaxID=335020 RepID=A0A1I3XXM3_9HYPH|nr:hypothetical protein [Mesorhizobium albiziae]GLS30276.1 hypothetical protein GCM10007937_19840 [Mesorhizobium albiziae]SFK24019.1 hypothetical protein SAMN04488498_10415 [Mesorhizobium albiziae]
MFTRHPGCTLEAKIDLAAQTFADRNQWLPPYRRIAALRRLATLFGEQKDHRLYATISSNPGVARSWLCQSAPDSYEANNRLN